MIQDLNDLPEYCQSYLKTLEPELSFTKSSVNNALQFSENATRKVLSLIDDKNKDFFYAEGKWSVAEVLGHLLDCERIFVYRALTIARERELQTIEGFDENMYADESNYSLREIYSLLEEYKALQTATRHFFSGLTQRELHKIGSTSGYNVTPRTIGMLISAHRLHHVNIIENKYLSTNK